MKLVHYSKAPLASLHSDYQDVDAIKPNGLWVSDDHCPDNWFTWCTGEDFQTGRLAHAVEIHLAPAANVLMITTIPELRRFHETHCPNPSDRHARPNWINLSFQYDGIVISPYQWQIRMDYFWYYGWDCASGCIWNAGAIESWTIVNPYATP